MASEVFGVMCGRCSPLVRVDVKQNSHDFFTVLLLMSTFDILPIVPMIFIFHFLLGLPHKYRFCKYLLGVSFYLFISSYLKNSSS